MSPERESASKGDSSDYLAVVEFLAASGRWPVGTIGTIVEQWADRALVEIADDRGHTLDVIELPLPLLRRVEASQQEHLSV